MYEVRLCWPPAPPWRAGDDGAPVLLPVLLKPAKEDEEVTEAEEGGLAALKKRIMSLKLIRPRAAASMDARYLHKVLEKA